MPEGLRLANEDIRLANEGLRVACMLHLDKIWMRLTYSNEARLPHIQP